MIEPRDLQITEEDILVYKGLYEKCHRGKEIPDESCEGCEYLTKKSRKLREKYIKYILGETILITLYCRMLGTQSSYIKKV